MFPPECFLFNRKKNGYAKLRADEITLSEPLTSVRGRVVFLYMEEINFLQTRCFDQSPIRITLKCLLNTRSYNMVLENLESDNKWNITKKYILDTSHFWDIFDSFVQILRYLWGSYLSNKPVLENQYFAPIQKHPSASQACEGQLRVVASSRNSVYIFFISKGKRHPNKDTFISTTDLKRIPLDSLTYYLNVSYMWNHENHSIPAHKSFHSRITTCCWLFLISSMTYNSQSIQLRLVRRLSDSRTRWKFHIVSHIGIAKRKLESTFVRSHERMWTTTEC